MPFESATLDPPPACVTVNVWPPIDSVPAREALPEFVATEYPTVPPPFPLAPEVMVIQLALLVAAQPHPLRAATVTVPLPDGGSFVLRRLERAR